MQPVRDVFAAVFFVSVGMLIDPADIAAHWVAVAVFLVAVVVGKVCSVTFSAFLTGQSIQTSLKSGMSLAQIGEFSFIIAGIGVATHATDNVLYSIAVAVSALTTLLTPWLIRSAGDDRRGCRSQAAASSANVRGPLRIVVRAFACHASAVRETSRVQRLSRWLVADAAVFTAIVIGASIEFGEMSDRLEQLMNLAPTAPCC